MNDSLTGLEKYSQQGYHHTNGAQEIKSLACHYWISVFESAPVVPWLSYSPLDPKLAGSNPAGVDGFFQNVKILSMTSFGREVKPWVPCRRFTARKKTSNRN